MNFDYNEEQRLLADSVRRFVAQDYGSRSGAASSHRPTDSAPRPGTRWRSSAFSACRSRPTTADSAGGAVDMMSTMEAIGEALVVEPYLATVGLGARCLSVAGSEAQRQATLPPVVEGKLKLAFAHTEEGARYNLAHVALAERGGALSGTKRVVLHAPHADKLIVSRVRPAACPIRTASACTWWMRRRREFR
jgi:alkylation response protein AidB-like acyl-CoA dehydrogenase